MTLKKIRVAVLYGGRSSEHEVSLRSAAHVMQHLDTEQFDIIPIKINKQGAWLLGDIRFLETETNLSNVLPAVIDEQSQTQFDVIFPVIHGPLCEDGTIQGLLEIANLPYVGCGVLASAIGMDKDVSKRLVKQAGILTSPHIAIKYSEWKTHPELCCERIHKALTYPLFVKPSNAGSSVGVQKVKHKNALFTAINSAFQYDTKIVVEQGIDAIEIELAVLQSISGQEPIVSIPGEVRPTSRHEFYSYESKYLDENGVELLIPAPISPALAQQAKQHAKDIFMALECEGMARVDLFIERHTNEIYFNEINSIPGFTDVSMYPKLMVASGISYTDLLSQLILLAIKRHEAKTNLAREYISS